MNTNRRLLLAALSGTPVLLNGALALAQSEDAAPTPAGNEAPHSEATPALLPPAVLPTAPPATPAETKPATTQPYPARADVQEFIAAAVATHGLERNWLEIVLQQGRYAEISEKLTTPSNAPTAPRNWFDYRARNVDERRVREGVSFWRTHAAALARASVQFGVPAEIVVAIVGIETFFGRVMGNVRTLDALLTLSFDYTRRAALYRDELTHFLLWCREQGLDPTTLRGSFAGAMGWPQFMPGSIRRYAIDFDGDGRVDLIRSPVDAIGSVANFLYQHGWEREQPVAFPAQADASHVEVLGKGIRAAYRWQDLAALGIKLDGTLQDDARVLLMDLPTISGSGETGAEYRIGTVNLSALLHYNRSYFYAAAVNDLAHALRERMQMQRVARNGAER